MLSDMPSFSFLCHPIINILPVMSLAIMVFIVNKYIGSYNHMQYIKERSRQGSAVCFDILHRGVGTRRGQGGQHPHLFWQTF